MTKFIRILSCILTIAFFVYFWNAEPMKPLKMFVVMLHEVSHGIGTLLTGGTVKGFTLGLDESGLLKLNCDKAINVLGWSSVLDFDETIEFIAECLKFIRL